MTGFHVCSQNTFEPENIIAAYSYSIETAASVSLPEIFPKVDVSSVSAAPKNGVSQYFNRKAWFLIWHLYSLFSVITTSRGLHSFSRSEGARKSSSLIQTSRWLRTGPQRGLSAPHWSTHKIPPLASPQPVLYQLTGREGTHRRAH